MQVLLVVLTVLVSLVRRTQERLLFHVITACESLKIVSLLGWEGWRGGDGLRGRRWLERGRWLEREEMVEE